ncbi:hypothetical protein [Pseudomonas aeruginosa]|uniref:hypothetical protein n=1 Tax=Pseudomonas aeruginosa TaxID=287 RepID=UPI00053EFA19|nr:hypothetical protein [Pseudomonas aeruginosa]
MPKFELIRMEGLRTYGRQVEARTWREAEQQCHDGEIVNGELIGVYDCDPLAVVKSIWPEGRIEQ